MRWFAAAWSELSGARGSTGAASGPAGLAQRVDGSVVAGRQVMGLVPERLRLAA